MKQRWRIPFVSVEGTRYHIEIYDKNWTGGLTVLQGGDQPITTEEDAKTDIFQSIRTQSGTIQVCTAIPGGGLLTIDEILPSNNTERLVVLYKLDEEDPGDYGSATVEWQGFLSCESYTQNYIGTPQILQLSLISVLEAMDSVEINQYRITSTDTVNSIVAMMLLDMEDTVGTSLFGDIYFSGAGRNILTKYINTDIFYEDKNHQDEGYTTHYIQGKSVKEVLNIIATFMGWCVREHGNNLFFQTAGAEGIVIKTNLSNLYEDQFSSAHYTEENTQLGDIADLAWRGKGHKRSVAQGARSVEIIATLTETKADIKIPTGFPPGGYIVGGSGFKENNPSEDDTPMTAYFSTEQNFDSRYHFQIWHEYDRNEKPIWEKEGTVSDLVRGCSFYPIEYVYNYYRGCTMIKFIDEDQEVKRDGLFVRGTTLQGWITIVKQDPSIYILKMTQAAPIGVQNGKFVIKVGGFASVNQIINSDLETHNGFYTMDEEWSVPLVVKHGSLYWQGNKWGSAYTIVYFKAGETELPITSFNYGTLEVRIPPIGAQCSNSYIGGREDFVLTDLSLTYELPDDLFDDRDNNTYYEPLGGAFKKEISVTLDIASCNKNYPKASIILNRDPDSAYDPLTQMTFYGTTQRTIRPEHLLLERMADYYRKARTSLKLQVMQPTTPLPLLNLRGINDGKMYLPMAASRDWQMEQTTLTCLEVEHFCQVRNEDGQLWDEHFDYVLLHGNGSTKTIYITSSCDLTWWDEDWNLQSVTLNGVNGEGTIPAGTSVPVTFKLNREENLKGRIILYQQGRKVAAIEVVGEY